MSPLFPYANVLTAILLLIVGFGLHFVSQFISILDWERACRIGLQDKNIPPDALHYEHGTATADVAIAWIYGVAAIGLMMNAPWGYKLAFIPVSILLYHGMCAWEWERDRRAAGKGIWTDGFRLARCGANILAGLAVLVVAWAGLARMSEGRSRHATRSDYPSLGLSRHGRGC